jgi:hypothetical protein
MSHQNSHARNYQNSITNLEYNRTGTNLKPKKNALLTFKRFFNLITMVFFQKPLVLIYEDFFNTYTHLY